MEKLFFSKENITILNKQIIENLNLSDISDVMRKKILSILIDNMKIIFKSIDLTKINNNNINIILNQFKTHSINQTLDKLKSIIVKSNQSIDNNKQSIDNIPSKETIADMKFKRDFMNTSNTNIVLNRPISSREKSSNSNSTSNTNSFENNFNNFNNFNNDIDTNSSLDSIFQPILPESVINQYTDTKPEQIKIKDLEKIRQSEVGYLNNRPPTPDFIKSKARNNNQESESNNSNQLNPQNNIINQQSNIINQQTNIISELVNDTGDNLFSIDNIDKPLIDEEIIEDSSNFNDRLKKLQSERDNVNSMIPINQNQHQLSNDSNNLNSRKLDSNHIQESNHNLNQRQNDNNNNNFTNHRHQEVNNHLNDNNDYLNHSQREFNNKFNQNQSNDNQHQLESNNNLIQKQNESNITESYNNTISYNNQTLNISNNTENKINTNQGENNQIDYNLIHANQINNNSSSNNNSNNNNVSNNINNSNSYSNNNQAYNNSNNINNNNSNQAYNNSNNINNNNSNQAYNNTNNNTNNTNQINNDATNNQLYNSITNNIQVINEKLSIDLQILKNKEKEFEQKILELTLLSKNIDNIISNYNYLFRIQYLQLEISDKENKSSYVWNFIEPIDNIIGIKLMSYSLPLPRYNINKNNNDSLKLLIDNEEYEIIIPEGFYNIHELINYINKELDDGGEIKISLSLDISQKIKIISNESIKLIKTKLLIENLGFINLLDDTLNDTLNKDTLDKDTPQVEVLEHNAMNTWDLRLDNKVYIYLKNLSENIPFGILYFNNISICNFKFQKPFSLSNLEIEFRDDAGGIYNFYNLKHELNFIMEKLL